MLTVATTFWRANRYTAPASAGYTPEWVNRLARAFARNLTVPHRFVALTDRPYDFDDGIEQERLSTDEPTWASMVEPFRLEGPLIVTGLDTVICGNLDEMARHCETADRIALPRSPGKPFACNAIVLTPPGQTGIYTRWRGENDMEWLRQQPHDFIDDLFPGQVSSFKCDIRPNGLRDTRVAYFHGLPKMADVADLHWVREHWI